MERGTDVKWEPLGFLEKTPIEIEAKERHDISEHPIDGHLNRGDFITFRIEIGVHIGGNG